MITSFDSGVQNGCRWGIGVIWTGGTVRPSTVMTPGAAAVWVGVGRRQAKITMMIMMIIMITTTIHHKLPPAVPVAARR